MTSTVPVQCLACDRLNRRPVLVTIPGDKRVKVDNCEAFPVVIPLAIALSGADHRDPFADDNGLQFKQAEGPEAEQAFIDWQNTFGQPDR